MKEPSALILATRRLEALAPKLGRVVDGDFKATTPWMLRVERIRLLIG